MAVRNPFTITYGGFSVGGNSDIYLLDGPYVIDKAFESLRVVFDVVVVATSLSDLATRADALEQAYDRRDQSLVIDIDGTAWSYAFGSSLLNSTATISKSGDRERDRGFSRAYTCTVEGELPASDSSGLREVQISLSYDASRRRTVQFSGVYTTIGGAGARQQYEAEFDDEANTYIAAMSGGPTMELVEENVAQDRTNHLASFSRTYVEQIFNQSKNDLDAAEIRDHRVTFTDLSQYPGDAIKGVTRLRRVVATYECGIDLDESTDPQDVYTEIIRPHIIQAFTSSFEASVYAVEDERSTFDRTGNRVSATMQILWQPSATNPGDNPNIVEVTRSLAYRETRQIDYTPIHSGDEFAMNADPGWANRERIWTRVVIVVGDEAPRRRIGEIDHGNNLPAGDFDEAIAGSHAGLGPIPGVRSSGWNVISNMSQVSDQYIGNPANNQEQIKLSVLTETVIEQYSKRGTGRSTQTGFGSGPFIQDRRV